MRESDASPVVFSIPNTNRPSELPRLGLFSSPRCSVGGKLLRRGDGRQIAPGKHVLKKAQQFGVD
jgi:hypothetical protein